MIRNNRILRPEIQKKSRKFIISVQAKGIKVGYGNFYLFFFYFDGFPYSRVKLINNSHNQIVSALANFSSYFTVSTYFVCKMIRDNIISPSQQKKKFEDLYVVFSVFVNM